MQCALALVLTTLIPGEELSFLGYVVPTLASLPVSEWGDLIIYPWQAGVVRIVDDQNLSSYGTSC